VSFLAE
jgi:hypothetical protein